MDRLKGQHLLKFSFHYYKNSKFCRQPPQTFVFFLIHNCYVMVNVVLLNVHCWKKIWEFLNFEEYGEWV